MIILHRMNHNSYGQRSIYLTLVWSYVLGLKNSKFLKMAHKEEIVFLKTVELFDQNSIKFGLGILNMEYNVLRRVILYSINSKRPAKRVQYDQVKLYNESKCVVPTWLTKSCHSLHQLFFENGTGFVWFWQPVCSRISKFFTSE